MLKAPEMENVCTPPSTTLLDQAEGTLYTSVKVISESVSDR